MTSLQRFLLAIPVVGVGIFLSLPTPSQAQSFTVQVGPPPLPLTALVQSTDTWHYRKGTSAPPAMWQTLSDESLDGEWLTGPGGFGYADNGGEVVSVGTPLNDMRNGYSTVYVRKSFEVTESVDPSAQLLLTMDWDDGFVAYLDGVEIQRQNTGGIPSDAEPDYNDTASPNHESSNGSGGNPPTTFNLGPVGSRLEPGTHILSILGLNGTLNSSDFILIADLAIDPNTQVDGPFLSVTHESSITVSGDNTLPNATAVVVDGVAATFDEGLGTWTIDQPLQPGANQIVIDVIDDRGVPILTTNKLIVYEATSSIVGGTLPGATVWDESSGIVHVTSDVIIPSGGSLTVQPGAVVLLNAGQSIVAEAGGSFLAAGNAENQVLFGPADGTSIWGELAATGEDASLTLQHVETIAGAVKVRDQARGLLEDSYIHHYKSGSIPIAGCTRALEVTVRRCRFNVYHETLWQVTPIVVEDSLFENANNPSSDALDFDTAPPGSIIRRCTFRNGPEDNTDAIDLGSDSQQVVVEGCLMANFPNDKGVSIGEDSFDIVVRNCLMFGCDSGVAVKDSCTAFIYGNTIVDCNSGFRCYNKANPSSSTGGGHITESYDNVLWGFAETAVSLENGSTMTADYSNFQGTDFPGTGNLDIDPSFVNALEGDFRLSGDSLLRGAGKDGRDMGAHFPVGAPMAPSHPVFQSISLQEEAVQLEFIADHERSYSVEYSDDAAGEVWTKLQDIWPRPWPVHTKIVDSLADHPARFYRLVSPARM